jgi:hypothetical protein
MGVFMKLSFKQMVFSTMLLSFAVSCGGSKSGGGSNSVPNPYSSFNYGSSLISGSAAYTSLVNWGDALETQALPFPTVQVLKDSYNLSSCSSKTFIGIPYQVCTAGSSTPTPLAPSYVTAVGSQARKLYPNVASIITPAAGFVLINVETQNNYIMVYHVETASNKIIKYTIDTTLNAALNPRIEENNVTGKATVLKNY